LIVLFRDDLDGSEKGVRAVKFEFEGASYEIDLGPKNQTKLRKVLTPYIEAGTKVSARTSTRGGSAAAARSSSAAAQKAFNSRVREWAAANGHTVKPRGRVPETAIDAYRKAGNK
jgi:hypothetical protein